MRQDTKETIDNYVSKGWSPGGFVTAVLANDLMRAMGAADTDNRHNLFHICMYVYNNIPASCHGSYEKVDAWLAKFNKPSEDQTT